MATINRDALQDIRWAGLTRAQYVAEYSTDGTWYGDRCGCPDDRCIGYHHLADQECGCLDPAIRYVLEARHRAETIAVSPELAALSAEVTATYQALTNEFVRFPHAADREEGSTGCAAVRHQRQMHADASLALELALGNVVPEYSWMRARA